VGSLTGRLDRLEAIHAKQDQRPPCTILLPCKGDEGQSPGSWLAITNPPLRTRYIPFNEAQTDPRLADHFMEVPTP
jgi:hypothetical protein